MSTGPGAGRGGAGQGRAGRGSLTIVRVLAQVRPLSSISFFSDGPRKQQTAETAAETAEEKRPKQLFLFSFEG